MTEKIKSALLKWASKVLDQNAQWDDEKTHEAIQKLYDPTARLDFGHILYYGRSGRLDHALTAHGA